MNEVQPSRTLHRYAVFVAGCTLALVFAGGLVTSKGAGLAVPDWPLTFGRMFPEGWFRAENVRAEHSHRVLAGITGMLTLILAIWIRITDPRPWLRKVGVLAVVTVIFQALLGGVIIKSFSDIQARMSHAVTGQTYFCIMVSLALFTSPAWARPVTPAVDRRILSTRAVCLLLTAGVFLQLLFGALMRHTHAGLAIPDFPLSYGRLLPPLDRASVHNINVDRFYEQLPELSSGQILIHYVHRVWAVFVALLAALAALRVFREHSSRAGLLIPAILILVLLMMQIVLGAMVILTGRQPHITTTHVAVGAAILALSVVLTLQAFRHVRPAGAELAGTNPAPSGGAGSDKSGRGPAEASA